MKQSIINEARKIFAASESADIVTDFNLLFSEQFLDGLESKLADIKKETLAPRYGINFDDTLWSFEDKIREELVWRLLDFALENDKAFALDWKFTAADAIYNLKRLLPDTNINSLGEKQISGDWYEQIEINGEKIDFKKENDELLINRVIRHAYSYLEKKFGKTFLTTDVGGDNHYFLMVTSSVVKDFENFGFYLP